MPPLVVPAYMVSGLLGSMAIDFTFVIETPLLITVHNAPLFVDLNILPLRVPA